MAGADELEVLAKLEAEPPSEGPTMMGRKARELMLSGQGDQALITFKVNYSVGDERMNTLGVLYFTLSHIFSA